MGIAKFDDGIPDQPKFITAGPVACWLWFCGVLYCRRALTDGFIPTKKVPTLVVGLPQPYKHAITLVNVGLWETAEDGFQVHDYLDWNPSKATVEDYRKRDKERKHKQNPSRIPDGIQTESERRGASRAGAKSKSESEDLDLDLDLQDESAREGTALEPVWTNRGRASTGLAVSHRACLPVAAAACGRGVCIPAFLIQREWLPQVSHDEDKVRAFVGMVIASMPDGPEGMNPLKFWRAQWEAAHGSSVNTAPKTKTDHSLDAARRVLAMIDRRES